MNFTPYTHWANKRHLVKTSTLSLEQIEEIKDSIESCRNEIKLLMKDLDKSKEAVELQSFIIKCEAIGLKVGTRFLFWDKPWEIIGFGCNYSAYAECKNVKTNGKLGLKDLNLAVWNLDHIKVLPEPKK